MCSVNFNQPFGFNIKNMQDMQKLKFGQATRQTNSSFNPNSSIFGGGGQIASLNNKSNIFTKAGLGAQNTTLSSHQNTRATNLWDSMDAEIMKGFDSNGNAGNAKESKGAGKNMFQRMFNGFRAGRNQSHRVATNMNSHNKVDSKNTGNSSQINTQNATDTVKNASTLEMAKEAVGVVKDLNEMVSSFKTKKTSDKQAAEAKSNQTEKNENDAAKKLENDKNNLTKAQEEHTKAQEGVQTAETNLANATSSLDSANEGVASAKEALAQAKASATSDNPNSAAIARAEANLRAAEAKQEAAEQEKTKAESELSQAKEQLAKSETNLDSAKKQVEVSEKAYNDAKAETKEAKEKLAASEKDISKVATDEAKVDAAKNDADKKVEEFSQQEIPKNDNKEPIAPGDTSSPEPSVVPENSEPPITPSSPENKEISPAGKETNQDNSTAKTDDKASTRGFSENSAVTLYSKDGDSEKDFQVVDGKYQVDGQVVSEAEFVAEYDKALSTSDGQSEIHDTFTSQDVANLTNKSNTTSKTQVDTKSTNVNSKGVSNNVAENKTQNTNVPDAKVYKSLDDAKAKIAKNGNDVKDNAELDENSNKEREQDLVKLQDNINKMEFGECMQIGDRLYQKDMRGGVEEYKISVENGKTSLYSTQSKFDVVGGKLLKTQTVEYTEDHLPPKGSTATHYREYYVDGEKVSLEDYNKLLKQAKQ